MTDHTKTFTYDVEGLSYVVTVYQDPETGAFLADITTTEGAMDVNAIYFGDDDFSGDSEGLKGPLNMNGSHYEEDVQWDSAVRLSDPGLGPDGTDKQTYVSEGDTLTVELDIDSLDEIDFFGIRATSTSTEEGSIKAISEETPPEEPEEDPTFDKVGFGVEIDDNGGISNGVFVTEDDLPDGQDGTFENYVNHYVDQFGTDPDYALPEVESVVFYSVTPGEDENGEPIDIPQELFRIDAPEGGWQSSDELMTAYDEAIENGALEGEDAEADEGLELIAALSLPPDSESSMPEEEEQMDLIEMDMI